MKKLFLLVLAAGINTALYSQQQYDMSYSQFREFIKEEMSEAEFRSVDEYFEGKVDGLICTYEYGDFSGDEMDELVVLTSEDSFEQSSRINVYVFSGKENGRFEFVDKISYPYWKTRYEVAILIKRGVLFVTNTDRDYAKWAWNIFRIKDEKLDLMKKEIYEDTP